MIDLFFGLAAFLAGGLAAQALVWALSRGGIVIDATIQIAFVFALQLFNFFCGYVSGIRRGRAMELKRWRRRHQPRLSGTPLNPPPDFP